MRHKYLSFYLRSKYLYLLRIYSLQPSNIHIIFVTEEVSKQLKSKDDKELQP